MPLKFYNTLTRKKEEFSPIDRALVRMYSCGPTVYDSVHIGNLRSYVFADILCRIIKYSGLKLKQIMNITDMGHLSGDADSGEDKMTQGLLREGKELTLKNMRKLAEFYARKFQEDMQKLNIHMPAGMYFASDYVREDIKLIQKLKEKGYIYEISDGIYFDTAEFPDYGKLRGNNALEWDLVGARIPQTGEKKKPIDFALWKFNKKIGFDSPFGKGFPGWHVECSAMSMKFLGEQFDIHTGGIDLIPIHHTNEIAQSESATGKKPFVKFWMHSEFVGIGGAKMAKSDKNFYTLRDVIDKGIDPIAFRFWLLMGHYRTKMNFNWEALEGSEIALKRLYELYMGLGKDIGNIDKKYQQKFKDYIEDDLDTPQALSLLWNLVKDSNISKADKKATILDFDKVFGLGFDKLKEEIIPEDILKLAKEREETRNKKDFKKSDELREKMNSLGYEAKDTPEGQKISKI